MTLEEYISKNYSKEKLDEYSLFSGWRENIIEIACKAWQSAKDYSDEKEIKFLAEKYS